MGNFPSVDTSWMSQLGQTPGNLRMQNAPLPGPDIGVGGIGSVQPPQQQTGFLSNLLNFGQNPMGQTQQPGMLNRLLSQNQQQQPNPAVSPQVGTAAAAHGLNAPSDPAIALI